MGGVSNQRIYVSGREVISAMLEAVTNIINKNYGSKRGLAQSLLFWIAYRLRVFRKLQEIDWQRVERLVFICSGNICRSPLAEVYAKSFGAQAESFGLHCRNDFPADARAAEFGKSIGVDLGAHRTRNIEAYVPLRGDLVVGMEPKHLLELTEPVRRTAQVTLAGLWLTLPTPYLHDPFNTRIEFFWACENRVVAATKTLVALILQ